MLCRYANWHNLYKNVLLLIVLVPYFLLLKSASLIFYTLPIFRNSMTYRTTYSGSMSITVDKDVGQLALSTILARLYSTSSALKCSTVVLSLSQIMPPTFLISPLMTVILSSWSHLITSSSLEVSSTTPTRE